MNSFRKVGAGTLFAMLSSMISVFSFAQSDSQSPVGAAEAFDKMQSLLGNWKKEGSEGEKFYIAFTSTAGDSVLVETWYYNGNAHSLTLYHRDGDKLLATHYCPQGNQPRLALEAGATQSKMDFLFQDATNLESLDRSHQHALGFEFEKAGKVLRHETYRKGDEEEASILILVRM